MQALLLLALVLPALCATAVDDEKDPLIHEYLKLGLWLLFGVIVGVFFEAKMSVEEIVRPLVKKGVLGIAIAFGIYFIFTFGNLVTHYL